MTYDMTDDICEFEIRIGLDKVRDLIDSDDVVYLVAVTRTEKQPVIYAREQPQEVQFPLANVTNLKLAVMYSHQQSPDNCCLNRKCWPC